MAHHRVHGGGGHAHHHGGHARTHAHATGGHHGAAHAARAAGDHAAKEAARKAAEREMAKQAAKKDAERQAAKQDADKVTKPGVQASGMKLQDEGAGKVKAGGSPRDRARAAIQQAADLVVASGVPASKINVDALVKVAGKESTWNPRAINRWDSNAKAGHPSKGLLQTIDSTFQRYKLPGRNDIFNPVDNAAAAIRYAVDRYGSVDNLPGVRSMARGGQYKGY
ncbi:MAG: transglycosylase SLT domain-containing protein [Candidatus Sericytochromatia bacterium]|nr:transglycosylase SLT domain-containing protein [Candidatus Sericytochromatia bacterium]